MTPGTALLALAALVPAMTGVPSPSAQGAVGGLAVRLCDGGAMVLRVGHQLPVTATQPCCAKGCRTKRRRIDPKQ